MAGKKKAEQGYMKVLINKDTYLLPRKCRTCKYAYFEAGSKNQTMCNYMALTGKARGCDYNNCTKYESSKRRKMAAQNGGGSTKM